MNNKAIRYGVFAGMLTVLYFELFFFYDKRVMLSPGVQWGSFVIFLVFMYKAGRDLVIATPGELRTKDVLKPIFTVFVIANTIYYVYYYLLMNYFSPDLVAIQEEVIKSYGGDLSTAKPDISMKSMLIGYSSGTIGGFIISLIMSIIAKK